MVLSLWSQMWSPRAFRLGMMFGSRTILSLPLGRLVTTRTIKTATAMGGGMEQDEPRKTVFAVSTGRGKSALAVVRITGPQAFQALREISRVAEEPLHRQMTLRRLYHPSTKELLDRGMVVGFRGPASFTGEDVVELHVHGGNAIVAGLLEALALVKGLAPAEPGEFSKRAFLNGKMDLTQAEGVHDLINAETESQRRQALRQMQGELRQIYEGWRRALVKAMAHTEARIDFGEEQLEDESLHEIIEEVTVLKKEIQRYLEDGRKGEIVRDGVHITIMGAPNAGKSSLMNALAQRDVVIVSPRAGTTRDVVEVSLNLGGYQVHVSDTAGLRADTLDPIEQQGIARATQRIKSADLKLLVVDVLELLNAEGRDRFKLAMESHVDDRTLLLVNKLDLAPQFSAAEASNLFSVPVPAIGISCVTPNGLTSLLESLVSRISKEFEQNPSESLKVTHARHRILLRDTVDHLGRFQENATQEVVVLAAEDLRHAASSLGRITGRVDVEEILDVLFKDFCIGK